MNLKTLFIVIVGSIIIGVLIFLFEQRVNGHQSLQSNSAISENLSNTPTPAAKAAKPTLPPINSSSNLKEEIQKLIPPDYSEDFKNLREQI